MKLTSSEFILIEFFLTIPPTLILFVSNSDKINFIITDFKNEINVVYSGIIPNLFQEKKGVVAEGVLRDKSFFKAEKILAKHDENYMPPEVKASLGEN